jgi:hypothetical protein
VTFSVNMTCSGQAFTTPYITGPFCNWCNQGFALADPDGDGLWAGTFQFPNGPVEFKFMVDNFASQEDLVDNVIAGDGACAPITDGAVYANRQVIVDGPTQVDALYGECSVCAPPAGVGGCTNPDATNYNAAADRDDGSCLFNVTFSLDMGCSGLEAFQTVHVTGPFCGFCDRGFDLTDEDGDGLWTGTFPFAAGALEYKYMVDNFANQENLIDDMVDGGQCAPVTDYANYANRLVQIEGPTALQETYGSCGLCP